MTLFVRQVNAKIFRRSVITLGSFASEETTSSSVKDTVYCNQVVDHFMCCLFRQCGSTQAQGSVLGFETTNASIFSQA